MINELQQQEAAKDDKKKILEMLQRLEEPADEPEDDEWEDLDSDDDVRETVDLADRLSEVDLNNADAVWERLTDEEKQEFKSIIYNGEIEKIVKNVESWWKLKLEVKMVNDIQANETKVKEIIKKCPKVHGNIKDFRSFSSKTPAPCIIYNIANVIGAYAYIFRYYNGDHQSYEEEATENLISISDNLRVNANFECVSSVADSIMLNCHNFNLFSDLNTKAKILEDVKEILSGPGDEEHFCSFILSALSDTLKLFRAAKLKQKGLKDSPITSTEGTSKNFSAEFVSGDDKTDFKQLQNQSHFAGCIRKLEFFMSFVKFRYSRNEWTIIV